MGTTRVTAVAVEITKKRPGREPYTSDGVGLTLQASITTDSIEGLQTAVASLMEEAEAMVNAQLVSYQGDLEPLCRTVEGVRAHE